MSENAYWVASDHDGNKEKKVVVVNHGGRRDLSYNSTPVRDRSGSVVGYVMVFRDIADDIRMQRAVAEAQRLESIGQLASGISHRTDI